MRAVETALEHLRDNKSAEALALICLLRATPERLLESAGVPATEDGQRLIDFVIDFVATSYVLAQAIQQGDAVQLDLALEDALAAYKRKPS